MTAPTTFEIGTALANCVTLASLDVKSPEYNWSDFSKRVTTGSGLTRGLGFPVVEWHYGYLTSDQYDALKAYCPNGSDNVTIATYDNDRDILRYNCVMNMPDKYSLRGKGAEDSGEWRYLDVLITFTMLVAAE